MKYLVVGLATNINLGVPLQGLLKNSHFVIYLSHDVQVIDEWGTQVNSRKGNLQLFV